MESIKEVLHQMKSPALSPNTHECWCGGIGGEGPRYYPPFGPYAEPQMIYTKTCTCPAGLEEGERKHRLVREHNEEENAFHIRLRWRGSGIPRRFVDLRLGLFPNKETNPGLVERLTCPDGAVLGEDFDEAFSSWDGSWYFHGSLGVGKTGLAIGYAYENNKIMDSDESLLFVTLPAMLGELRSTYNHRREYDGPTEQEVIAKYTGASLLVLDDLGAEQVSGSGWVEDRLYQIIGQRHDDLRQTVFTSNLTLERLAKKIGDRVTWRILEMCGPDHIVEVKGPNLRDTKRPQP